VPAIHAVSSVHVVVIPRGEPPRLPSFPTYLMLAVACRARGRACATCRARAVRVPWRAVRVWRVVATVNVICLLFKLFIMDGDR
jgi:hypothetical protein